MTDIFHIVGKVAIESDEAQQNISKLGDGFTTLKGVISNLISDGINKLSSAITENLGGAIERVDTIASFERTMKNLGYTTEDVESATNRLKEGILGLPTTLPGIMTTQQQFSALLGDIDEATDLTLALNDAVLSGGQSTEVANSALNQWYQIIANGTPDMQSWRIINQAMPAQLNMIAEAVMGAGNKSNDLFSAWQDGKVTTEEIISALIDLDANGSDSLADFHTQALDSSRGIQTSMTNVKTAIKTALADVIEAMGGSERIASFFDKIKQWIKEITPQVTSFVTKVVSALDKFSAWCSQNQGLVQVMITLITSLATAIGTFTIVNKVVQKFVALKKAIEGFNLVATLVSSPVALVVAGIAALIVVIVAVVKNWDKIKETAVNVWNSIVNLWGKVSSWFTDNVLNPIQEVFENIKTAISEKIQSAWESITSVFNAISTWFTDNVLTPIVSIFDSVREGISNAWETIKNIIDVALQFIANLFTLYIDILLIPWNFIWQNFGDEITEVWNTIVEFISNVITTIAEFISTKWTEITTTATEVWTAISTFISDIWNSIYESVSTFITNVWTKITEVWNSIVTTTSEIWNSIITTISDVWNSIWTTISTWATEVWNTISTIFTNIWTKITEIWNSIKTSISNVVNSIKTTMSNVFTSAYTSVTTIFTNIKNKIKSTIEGARDVVKNAIDKIKSFFNFSWSLPKLKLPHISISGSFSLVPPSAPKFSIDWYKNGGILTDPTIFGFGKNGNLLGGGEAGAEAVAPIDTLMDYVSLAVEQSNSELSERIRGVLGVLEEYLPQLTERQIVLDTGTLVGELANPIDESLGTIQRRKGR